MGRSPCCSKEGLNRGAWTAMEDKMLIDYIKVHGEGKWKNLPKNAGLKRCGKSCRLRWLNYLRPDIKRGNITDDEEDLIIRLHKLLGNRWSLIAGRLPGRTDNEIKNYWNTNIGKKLQNRKIPSSRHTPKLLDQPDHDLKPVATNVVRTKASRCSEMVIIPHEPAQNNDHQQLVGQVLEPTVPPPPPPPASLASSSSSSSQFTSEHENPSKLTMMDFDMDDHDQLHLSDLFNNPNFSQLTNNFIDDGAPSHLSPHDHSDDHTLLLADDFPSMASLLESEFEWLLD